MFYDISIQIILCEYYKNGPAWNYPNAICPFDTFYFVLDGDGEIITDTERVPLLPNMVYLIPANLRFHVRCTQLIEKVYVQAYLDLLPGFGIFADETRIKSIPIPREQILGLNQNYPASLKAQLQLNSFLTALAAGFLNDDFTLPETKKLRFLPILNDVQTHIASNCSVEEIAGRNGWNSAYLSRTFHQEFGMTLKQYIDDTRMKRLKQELLLTEKTLRILAAEYHFSDAYSLSAFFKRHEGISPLSYRKTHAIQ